MHVNASNALLCMILYNENCIFISLVGLSLRFVCFLYEE